MRNSKYIIVGCLLVLGITSCKKWLDVNTDPNNPNNETILVQNRLPWIQKNFTYSAGVANFRAAAQCGIYYSNSAAGNALSTTWTSHTGNTTAYQSFFVQTASNLNDLYNTAQKQGAYHYMAAADVFHALGFMEMLDIYGEMPYTQALASIASPTFDDGKTIYYGCLAKLNEAIDLFSRTQEAAAPALSVGDMYNGGDVSKWIKLCWGLKARYMLKVSKKADLFNADSILYCLSKGPQSINDNVVLAGLNNSTVLDYLYTTDPVVTNGNFNYAAYGSNQRISKYYYDLLTNMRGSGVTDPRMPKIVPATMAGIKLDASGKVASFTWRRSTGVDIYGTATRLVKGGATSIVTVPTYLTANKNQSYPISDNTDRQNFINAQIAAGRAYTVKDTTVTVTYTAGSYYINSTNYLFAGDTAYVNLRSSSLATSGIATQGEKDVNWYTDLNAFNAGAIASTGSFQTRPVSDNEILTYHEMCFIKAEVYMRKGDQANAYTAYRDGIQAHMDMMQAKLNSWKADYAKNNPDMAPMDQTAITAYLGSTALAGAGTLTMQDIMLQKYIAMGCSIENWNDMRRFNFSAGNVGSFGVVYPGFDRGPLFAGGSLYTGGSKTDARYWPRRYPLPTNLELNYNLNNVLALNPHATEPNIWSMPVWWDCTTDAEYYGYLQ